MQSLLTGMQLTAIIQAARETGKTSGPEFAAAYEKAYASLSRSPPGGCRGEPD